VSSCCAEFAGSTDPIQLAVLFTTGLAISVGHCTGMCGPIVTAFAMSQRKRGVQSLRLHVALARYHGGRLLAYLMIGLLFGALAKGGASLSSGAQGIATLVAGSLMLGVGLILSGIFPGIGGRVVRALSRRVGCEIGRLLGARSGAAQIALGFFNGLLPCGPVAAVALAAAAAAASGRPLLSLLAMVAYGLGTVPALYVLGAGVTWMGPRLRRRLFRAGHLLLVAVAVQLMARGAAAVGWVPHFGFGEVRLW
jgi:sulfite exporter TauE/SafE